MVIAPLGCDRLGGPDVAILRALVAAAQKQNDQVAALLVVDAIAGPIVNSQFAHTFADWRRIARVSASETMEARGNHRLGPPVSQVTMPFPERRRLLELHRADCEL